MLQNFRVIMKYNPAEAYALAIGHFADRLRGGAALRAALAAAGTGAVARRAAGTAAACWPSAASTGARPDGQFGGQTREALRSFQASIGAPGGRICLLRRAGAAAGPLGA
mgnify:CR=1 FL=1